MRTAAQKTSGTGLSLKDVLRLPANAPARVIDGEMILVDIHVREVLHFNPTATWFVQQLDGKRTLAAVLRRILNRFKVDAASAQADLLELMESLFRQGVLERIEKP